MKLLIIATLFALPLIHTAGCGNSNSSVDADPFDTYQECWDEHHTEENFSVQRAIEICCIDHPIGGAAANTVCGDTATSYTSYVTSNLVSTEVTSTDISDACTDYVGDRAG